MKIEIKKLGEIREYEKNPRRNDKAVNAVAESIKEFGFKVPIVIDRDGVIVAGHTRYKASKKLGLNEIPCVVADDLTAEQIKAFRLADNKTAELSEWDIDLLSLELKELEGFDLDMNLFGFDTSLESGSIEIKEDNFDVEKELNSEECIVKNGDIWKLGEHMLKCGDSLKETAVKEFTDGIKIDMIFTDPPYDMVMGGSGCFAESMDNCMKRVEPLTHFDPSVLSWLKDFPVSSYYIFTSKDGIPKYLENFKGLNFNILMWDKTNPVPFTSGTFLPNIEYLLYFSKKDRIWNNSLKPTETYSKYYISEKLQGRKDGGGDLHPTMKPLEPISRAIRISSRNGGAVLDLFGGSGSTLIACEQLDRRCYMIEIEPKNCDVIIRRWEAFTGKTAERMNNVETENKD